MELPSGDPSAGLPTRKREYMQKLMEKSRAAAQADETPFHNGSAAYWAARYAAHEECGTSDEWICAFYEVAGFFAKHIPLTSKILHIG